MRLTEHLAYLLRGTGRRRAAATIPLIEAERDQWKNRCALADQLLIELWCARDTAERKYIQAATELAQAIADRDRTAEGHLYLLHEHDELAGRYTELRIELANLKAISAPAPADRGPAIPVHDPEQTHELTVTTLWDARGLRPLVA
jgi:hypothetical protein